MTICYMTHFQYVTWSAHNLTKIINHHSIPQIKYCTWRCMTMSYRSVTQCVMPKFPIKWRWREIFLVTLTVFHNAFISSSIYCIVCNDYITSFFINRFWHCVTNIIVHYLWAFSFIILVIIISWCIYICH